LNPILRKSVWYGLLACLVWLGSVSNQTLHAQNFPVQANTFIIPPYTVFLSEYASNSSEKLVTNLILKDMSQSQIQVRQQIEIKGQGITLRTRSSYQGRPITLVAGAPVRISGSQMAEYFNPDNLDFQGIRRHQFAKSGKLPKECISLVLPPSSIVAKKLFRTRQHPLHGSY